ncbi:DUF2848 family protein [Aminobacterium sp. MB27-C1]|jgi:hypothetical protein|uniref:DUF2848 family protein n=1 Tax=Aminobacterium sp. MB27-C1 TaxID=3070661 RepID=UPI001BCCE736|nr:DUF2848 family protein [Aminobacterium sp. MB27-C1]WMI72171.1 DUF2848 family protein [Aminobacterium sp. MB27-C1]
MKKIWFDVEDKNGNVTPTGFAIRNCCLFGWAGRNKDEIRKHAAELAEHGIRGPKSMPEHFLCSPNVVTQDDEITVVGDGTCGEIEFFFLEREGNIYVGVTSEHTDRSLEAVDMVKSKAICQKPMSTTVWKYEDVKDHWDDLELIAWQTKDGKEVVYQKEKLSALITLETLREEALKLYSNLEDCIIFSGTIPALNGLVYGEKFRGCLKDDVLGRSIGFEYSVKIVPADED